MLKNFDPLQKKGISLSLSPEVQNKHSITSITAVEIEGKTCALQVL